MFSPTRLLTVALTGGALLTMATPANATLTICHGTLVDAKGRGPSIEVAFGKAVNNWRIHTQAMLGSSYADWSSAADRGRNCNTIGATTYCRVYANPCPAGSGFGGGVNKKPVND
jgi:hypothetical protein